MRNWRLPWHQEPVVGHRTGKSKCPSEARLGTFIPRPPMWSPGEEGRGEGDMFEPKEGYSPWISKLWIRNKPWVKGPGTHSSEVKRICLYVVPRVGGHGGGAEGWLERGQGLEAARNSQALWKKKTEKDLRTFCHYGWWWRESTSKMPYPEVSATASDYHQTCWHVFIWVFTQNVCLF